MILYEQWGGGMKADFPVSEAKPAASVVFTVHNRREMLLRAIACIKGQSVPLEVVVIDDASTDGVEDAVKATTRKSNSYALKLPKGRAMRETWALRCAQPKSFSRSTTIQW